VTAPGWKVSTYYSEEDVAPVSALEVDEGGVGPGGSGTEMNPPLSAAQAFVAALGRNGIRAALGSATTAPTGAAQIAAVRSPTLAELVEYALTNSDNSIAEALLRQVAIAEHAPVSFAGGARAVHQVLARLGITSGVNTVDGSGLSRDDTITPGDLARIVATDASAAHPELRTVLTGIPIAGFSGTLALRYQSGASARGRGQVRAKTGTLDGVNTLTGYVDDADGRLLSFAFMANNVANVGDALGALDDLAAMLAGCGCR
jgi:D-alanyl-D-alanine carboxypeptidase/D-alanyl-D-alanine-endopeptidase (penicillin-binding protein 4)